MKKHTKTFPFNTDLLYLAAGVLFSLLLMVPYLILGTDSIVTYHDQLDGELLNYVLAAKYLFTGTEVYPELMNGLPATGAVPPAPLFVLFYYFFSPFTAFLLSQWFISIISFLGMYLLIKKLTKKRLPAFVMAVLFMMLPFYPVYGLCIPGQPLLLYGILCLRSLEIRLSDSGAHRKPTGKEWLQGIGCLFLVLLYSLSSSLVLVGFACLLALGLASLFMTCRALRRHSCFSLTPWLSLAVLLCGYLVCNLSLIRQVLFPAPGELSHKSEVVYTPVNFVDSFRSAFYPGIPYTEAWPVVLLPLTLLCLLFLLIAKRKKDSAACLSLRKALKKSAVIFSLLLLICALYALYSTAPVVDFRNSTEGALSGFNLGRIVWLLPTGWCILAGYLLSALCPDTPFSLKSLKHFYTSVRYLIILTVFALWGLIILLHSPLKANISKLVKGTDYYALDWGKFYATDIFEQIDDAIGRPKEDYRVISLGIYPAAAAYNGFYCLDGYSNNYPLAYKHSFREIMADELAKNEYIRLYFDNWGNRCYLTTAEYNNYYTIEKKWNGGFHDLSLNTTKLREMGCDYLFSATWILNADELGLTLLREEPFTTEDSWYNIYVYAVK
ncbi:MAG: DUF6044 family protein [Acetatifactor sp.]